MIKAHNKLIIFNNIAAQYVRTPARLHKRLMYYREQFPKEDIDKAFMDLVIKLEQALEENKPLPKSNIDESSNLLPLKVTFEENPDKIGGLLKYELLLGRGVWLYEIRHVVENTSKVLINHNWEIIEAAQWVNWCTSDDPLICLNYYGDKRYDFEGGWGTKGAEIILPLTPNHVLYTQIGCKKSIEFQKNPSFTFFVQKFILEHAYRSIFALKPFDSILSCRRRIVDKILYDNEMQAWTNWYKKQNKAEEKIRRNSIY